MDIRFDIFLFVYDEYKKLGNYINYIWNNSRFTENDVDGLNNMEKSLREIIGKKQKNN
jgi:hypothetical protein